MDRKKFIQIIIIIIVIVWAFCGSLLISTSIAKKAGNDSTTTQPYVYSTTATTVPTTTQPQTTTVPAETEPAFSVTIDNNVISTSVNVGDPDWKVEYDASVSASKEHAEINKNVPVGKDNIIKAYVDGVNKLKSTADFSLYKDDKLNLVIDEMPAENIAKTMAENLMQQAQKKPITYNFVGGTDSASGKTPNQAIAPLNVGAAVEESAVTTAVASATDDGGFKVTILMAPELQTYTTPAKNHATMVEVVDITPYIPKGLTINTLDMSYTDTRIEAVFDKDGRITSMVHFLKVERAVSNVSFLNFPVEVIVHGDFTSNYTFSY